MNNFKTLPINFRHLDDGRVLVSNLANFYHVLPNKDALYSIFVESQCNDKELLNDLEQRLFISSTEDFETKAQLTSAAFSKNINKDLNSPRLIMIVPTLRCDHHCSYCQVSRVNIKRSGFDLDIKKIPELINFITRIEKPPYKIEFQGGEALIAFDFIKQFYTQFNSLVDETLFECVITTSLSMLNQEILNWCKNRKVSFSTSIDAGRIAHNKHRKLDSKNSFELVTENIKWINSELGDGNVGTVTTITRDGLPYYDELVDIHLDLNLKGMFVRPVSDYGFAIGKQSKDLSIKEFMTFYKKLIYRVMTVNLEGHPLIEHFLLVHYKRILNGTSCNYVDLMSPAGYLKNSILIDYTGKIFGSDEARMVHRKHKDDSLVIGNIAQDELDLNLSGSLLEQSFNFDVPGCSDCVYQGSCGADPVHHLQNFGEPVGNKSLSRFCQLHIRMFDFVFELIKRPSYKQVLNGWLND